MNKNIFIVSAKRTAIGSYLGTLSTVHPAILGSSVIKNILDETGIPVQDIDEVVVGNILPAGQGQGVGRQVSIHAGIPDTVPAYSLNMACGSGMKAVMIAFANINAGLHQLVIAGGVESMSTAPYLLPAKVRNGTRMGDFSAMDHMILDALTDSFSHQHMGVTAENIAKKYEITREEQDQFALSSQHKAISAVDAGIFDAEIVPILVQQRKDSILCSRDEYPNRTTNIEKLSSLRPVFVEKGTVTAGNSSGINDGASFTLIASEEAVKKYNLTPLARIVAIGQGGVDPQYMGLGPVPAIGQALEQASLNLSAIDLIELNEAFAAQSLGVVKELSLLHHEKENDIRKRMNINGGAIALGHPVGASGNRILVTLVHALQREKQCLGLASLCIGGGMGTAIIIERC